MQAARAVWRKRQAWLVAHPEKIGNIVFIDETGINTKMARLRGRCRRGRRMVASIPHGHWKTMTFIAGLRFDGLTAPWVIEGAMDGDAFEKYIKTQLAPTLQKGDVVVLDNLPAHKRSAGHNAPPYSGSPQNAPPPGDATCPTQPSAPDEYVSLPNRPWSIPQKENRIMVRRLVKEN